MGGESNDGGKASEVKSKLNELFDEILRHEGYGHIEVDMKILRRGQKEVILRCGKEYRFVVDFPADQKKRRDQESASRP